MSKINPSDSDRPLSSTSPPEALQIPPRKPEIASLPLSEETKAALHKALDNVELTHAQRMYLRGVSDGYRSAKKETERKVEKAQREIGKVIEQLTKNLIARIQAELQAMRTAYERVRAIDRAAYTERDPGTRLN